jgi:hypothetical protein
MKMDVSTLNFNRHVENFVACLYTDDNRDALMKPTTGFSQAQEAVYWAKEQTKTSKIHHEMDIVAKNQDGSYFTRIVVALLPNEGLILVKDYWGELPNEINY